MEIDAALSAGDRHRALALIMARYGPGIYRFARAMTRDRSLAEEVRQQVFVEAYRDLEGYTVGTSLQAWIFGIARHRCIDAVHARTRWCERYKNQSAVEPESDEDLDRALDRNRLARMLAACLGKLAPAAREAVLLRYQQELSYDEAAVVAGDLPGTMQRRVARALPVLRKCMRASMTSGGSR